MSSSLEGGVEQQHRDEAANETHGRVGFVAVAVRLGDDLVADHEEHGSTREAEGPRQDRARERDGEGAHETAEALYEARAAGDRDGARPRVALRDERQRDHEALGEVLEEDSEREREAVLDLAATEAHADRQALGEVVQRDGDDEEPDLPQASGVDSGAVAWLDEVLVRCVPMDEENGGRPEDQARPDEGGASSTLPV